MQKVRYNIADHYSNFKFFSTSLLRVLFTFPSQYLFTIDFKLIFRLSWWSNHIQAGFPETRNTQNYFV